MKIFEMKKGDKIQIGKDIIVKYDGIVQPPYINQGSARLCFQAPRHIRIMREEIYDGEAKVE
jgi:sRNA-binding carbon storage regulator CsrA